MVGLTAFLLIFLVIQYEQSFDNFHPNKNNIYRVVRNGKNPVNKEYNTGVPLPVTSGLRREIPQIVNAAAIYGINNAQINITAQDGSVLKKFKEKSGVFIAEPNFFEMFNFKLAEGNIKDALNEPYTVLLTKNMASKYFGDWKTAIGKTLQISGSNIKVTGILENPPSNTDFPLGVVLSYASLVKNIGLNDWNTIDNNNYCFVQLPVNYSPKQFEKLLDEFTKEHITPINPDYALALQPLNEMHYDSRYGNFNGRTFSKDLIFALRLISLFLLIIACVNFINLTTAYAVNRAREVGVRKMLGGNRTQLAFQFLGETSVTVLLSIIGSLIAVFLCLPFLNNLLDIHLSVSVLYSAKFIVFMAGALFIITFLSGFYPALVLSNFNAVNVLKGNVSINNIKGISFRRALVVFQFVIAQALIVGTLVVASQMNYFKNTDMGFNKQAVLNVGFSGDNPSHTIMDLVRNELYKVPGVKDVSFSMFTPVGVGWNTDLRLNQNSNNADIQVSLRPADTSFFHLYNLSLVAGRIYFPSDTMREFVVNETLIKKSGIQNAQQAIGKLINVNGYTLPIVGVVKDFHINSLRDPIEPVVMTTIKNGYGVANVKIDIAKAKTVIAAMQNIWSKNFPDYVFEYNFIDQSIADYYKQENQLSQLYKIFSGIAIFISCLGLYGLISFMAAGRKKEIGIRKVLGAPVRDIVIMLSKEFTILIAIAFLIASPIAWYFMHQWLQQYTYRICLGAGFFGITIIASLMIGWMTVGYTAIRAALANPVRSLRTE